MIDPSDVHPVAEFAADPSAYVQRLKRTGRPEVLKAENGTAVIVQDAGAYEQQMLELDQRRLEVMALEGLASEPLRLTPEELRARLRAHLDSAKAAK